MTKEDYDPLPRLPSLDEVLKRLDSSQRIPARRESQDEPTAVRQGNITERTTTCPLAENHNAIVYEPKGIQISSEIRIITKRDGSTRVICRYCDTLPVVSRNVAVCLVNRARPCEYAD